MKKLRRLKYKKIVKVGENVKIKTLAEHEMETGVRRDTITGVIYPRLIIQSVIAKYNGKIVFDTTKKDGVKKKLLNNELIRKLGWKPKNKFEDTLRNYISKIKDEIVFD